MAKVDREAQERQLQAAMKMPREAGIRQIRKVTGLALEDAALHYDVSTGRNPDGDAKASD